MSFHKKIYFKAQNPGFLNLPKIGKPNSIYMGIFVLAVLEYKLQNLKRNKLF
jgi:hypothetical protein